MKLDSLSLWLIHFWNITSFFLYGFGRISRGNSKTIIEFIGGVLILLSIATMFILNGVVSGIVLIALSLLIVAPLTGFIMAWIEKKLYNPKTSIIFCKKCNFQVPYHYDNRTFYYCRKDKLGWNFEDINEDKKYYCEVCNELLRPYGMATFRCNCPICNHRLDVADKNTYLYKNIHQYTEEERQQYLKSSNKIVQELQDKKTPTKSVVNPKLKKQGDRMAKEMIESLNKEMLRKYGNKTAQP